VFPDFDAPVLDRDAELEAIEVSLANAGAGQGRLLLIEGPAGMGKSHMLARGRQMAGRAGVAVLGARGSEFEREVPFGVALELFGPSLQSAGPEERRRLFRGAAELAAPLFSGTPAPDEATEPPSSFPVVHGLYWLLANLAERQPLLVTIDDLHWADPSSLRFVHYLAERLDGLRVALVVGLRPEDVAAGGRVLARLRALPQARTLQLQPLSAPATASVTRRSFPGAEDEFCRAVRDVSGGNPFLVREILSTADLLGLPPTAGSAGRVRRLAPESVVRQTGVRISQLRPEAETLAQAAAVLGPDAHLRHVARLAKLDSHTAADSVHDLIEAGILRAGEPLDFAYPPVSEAVRSQIPPGARGALHAEAAAILADEDNRPERLAPHLVEAHATGNPEVVERLREAARRAVALGAPETAVRYLRRGLAEPPPAGDRPGLLLELGRVGATIGAPDALDHLKHALRLLSDPVARAEVLHEVGRTLVHGGRYREAVEALGQGLAEAGRPPSELRRRLLAALLQATRLVPGGRRADLVDSAEAAVGDHADGGLGSLLGELSFERLLAGRPADDVRITARQALGRFEVPVRRADSLPFYDTVAALTWTDDLDAAKAALDQALAEAERRGGLMAVATACFRRATVSYLAGAIASAVTDAQRAVDALTYGWATYLAAARGILALALIEQGELPRAAAALEPGGTPDPDAGSLPKALCLWGRSELNLAEGAPVEALSDALAAGRIMTEDLGFAGPAIVPWRTLAATAHHRLGDTAAAMRLAAEEVELARQFGARRSLGAALRVQGVVEPTRQGIVLLEEAVDVLAGSPARLEHARALADLGETLQRGGRPGAADALQRGLDLAERCGATLLCDRLRAALRATGARPARRRGNPTALTPTEERVAQLVAGGQTNKGVAQQLFVSVRAVEFHLGNVYSKLGISSRRQLPAALRRSGDEPRTSPVL
jgi:DNA-binding CsgD family transcriptional regulator